MLQRFRITMIDNNHWSVTPVGVFDANMHVRMFPSRRAAQEWVQEAEVAELGEHVGRDPYQRIGEFTERNFFLRMGEVGNGPEDR